MRGERMEGSELRLLKEYGLKLTPQRLAIIEYLKNNKNHPSAEDIYNALKEKFPSMSFATVYNTLEVLVEKGLIKELHIDSSKRRFDPFTHQHHHFKCRSCGRIIDIEADFEVYIPEFLKGYQVEDFQVVFSGLCPDCNKK